MNLFFFVTMYESLEKELKRDNVWKGADIDSAIKRTKFNDASRNQPYEEEDIKDRHNRCATRRIDRLSGPKMQKFDNFNSFLDEIYEIQYYKGFKPIEDFMNCICCPLIYDSKPILFEKLKGMIMNISEEPKHPMIKTHKLFNRSLLIYGIGISLKIPGIIPLSDAYLVLDNIDKLNLCQNCIYAVMCITMYETTSIMEYKDMLYNDASFMFHKILMSTDRIIYRNFLETKDDIYLKQLESMLCGNAAWYKELKK